ncbi:MAG: hypothetical protein M1816_004988 [Peltula sp. TS41687]|nr:MAG: hypothetical protein M1816_004988 [Peltula sp. TS41687]
MVGSISWLRLEVEDIFHQPKTNIRITMQAEKRTRRFASSTMLKPSIDNPYHSFEEVLWSGDEESSVMDIDPDEDEPALRIARTITFVAAGKARLRCINSFLPVMELCTTVRQANGVPNETRGEKRRNEENHYTGYAGMRKRANVYPK